VTAPVAGAAATTASAQAAQAGLAVALGYGVDAAWKRLDPSNLKTSLPEFRQLMAALIHRYGLASATMAVQQYRRDRAAAGITKPFIVRPVAPAPLEQVGKSLDWATQGLWAKEPNLIAVRTTVQGVAEKLTLQPGRDTIIGAVRADTEAKAWARVPEPGACSFCALLATRGAVYKKDTAGFKAHDHCKCHVEPVFGKYEPTAEIRQWEADYAAATKGVRGSKNLQIAWRRAFEGRTAPQ
jgi:hypothetical protein